MKLTTRRGYLLLDAASALQKSVRRADARLAGYFAVELFESGYAEYVWRRLLTISAEDCWGVITQEVWSLYQAWKTIDKAKRAEGAGRVFVAKATILLAMARKCRDADHLTNLVYDPKAIDDAAIQAALEAARKAPEVIPDYAFDCHTSRGKKAGKTREMFFRDEHRALTPREPGLFDEEVDRI